MNKKKSVIEQLNALHEATDEADNTQQVRALMKEWNSIGHVPFKEKDKIYKQYNDLLDKLFARFNISSSNKKLNTFKSSLNNLQEEGQQALYREREKLNRIYENMKSELQTYENNLGFLTASSKKGSSLLNEINRKVEKLKGEIELIKQKIQAVEENIRNEAHGK